MLTVEQESPDHADVAELLRLSDEYHAALYPRESCHGLDLRELIAQRVRFFVVRDFGSAVACGGLAPGPEQSGELKRMFVLDAERGRGLGRLILERIEFEAREEGICLMQLETGVNSWGALALYRRFGYRERGPFGPYRPDPLCVFMEKRLSTA
jgi:putative acetyltransferase